MSLINVNLGILIYSDPPASAQPNVRLADLKYSMQGLPTDNFKNIPISLAPGEIMQVTSTARTLSYNNGTNFNMHQNGDKMQIVGSFGQAIDRPNGDGSTLWTLTKNGNTMTLQSTGGTLTDFTNVVVGDIVKFMGTFQTYNQGEFVILGKGSNIIQFSNPLGTPESNVHAGVSIYSNGPVQVGDIVDISNPAFAYPNQGMFTVTAVEDTYIEVLNPNGFNQVVTGISNGFNVYPFAYKWMMVACDHRIVIGLNGDAPSSIEVEPPIEGDISRNPGLFVKRGKVFAIQIKNPGTRPAQGFVLLAE